MKIIFAFILMLLFQSTTANAEEDQKTSLWLNWGPELFKTSHSSGKDLSVRPKISAQVRFPFDFVTGLELGYYEYPSRNGDITRLSFGALAGYDFIRNRLRFLVNFSAIATNTGGFDDAGSLGIGTKLVYFHPIGSKWRLYAGVGGEYIGKVKQRHDTSHQSLKNDDDGCGLFCSSKDEKPTHIYIYNNIPATRELSAALGISYAFL
jgi:hypothetical protein